MNPDLTLTDAGGQAGTQRVVPAIKFKDKALAQLAMMSVVQRQLHRLGDGQRPRPMRVPFSVSFDQLRNKMLARRYRSGQADWFDSKLTSLPNIQPTKAHNCESTCFETLRQIR